MMMILQVARNGCVIYALQFYIEFAINIFVLIP